ncbi:uncharacterized protein FFUJ_14118 [Fusarium fujikuroi IMI 58289]|uniref:Uncharacterized protein n=1 Tax=Gibberella fujikuroi (strain CBS 195.34 / IMI 58289 / NRRL A-6831) TaxID=1279085 RepID=S0EPA9_GIBF5|nr:uncharacterized protein FFUJ_14118 [Fusarium fujikuroi IMI 58289]CCT76279.1 uncharacterized protein FFUJ_14118 [Fusarium fujikuroi IMI 58289]
MASAALQETWSRRNIPCLECMLFLARLGPDRIRRYSLCLESPSGAVRCRHCQHPETYSRCVAISAAALAIPTLQTTDQPDQILRGSELACIAVNLIHAVKAFQASTDEDKNAAQLISLPVANMQTHQTHARKAWESIWEVRKLDKNIDEKVREVRRLEEKLAQKTGEVKRFEEKLDEKKIAVEKLKNEIGQRKNKLRGLLNSVAM